MPEKLSAKFSWPALNRDHASKYLRIIFRAPIVERPTPRGWQVDSHVPSGGRIITMPNNNNNNKERRAVVSLCSGLRYAARQKRETAFSSFSLFGQGLDSEKWKEAEFGVAHHADVKRADRFLRRSSLILPTP